MNCMAASAYFVGIGELQPYQAVIHSFLQPNGGRTGDEEVPLRRFIDSAIAGVVAAVMQDADPGDAVAYALASIPKRFDYACELLYGHLTPAIGGAEAERLDLLEIITGGREAN